MVFPLGRLARFAAALVLMGCATSALSQPITLDDLLDAESFGDAALSPDGRIGVYERLGPWTQSTRFDLSYWSGWTTSELRVFEVRSTEVPQRLLATSEGRGHVLAAWSPSGRRLAIYRLRGDCLELGIVEMADRSVRWTGLSPDLSTTGRTLAWANDDTLVVSALGRPGLPWLMRQYAAPSSVEARWRLTAAGGEPAATAVSTHDGVAAADGDRPQTVLAAVSAGTGAVRMLSQTQTLDFEPSPDGRSIAVLNAGDPTGLQPGAPIQNATVVRARLSIIGLDDGSVRSPSEGLDVAPHLLSWERSGASVLVWSRTDGATWAAGALTTVKADNGGVRHLSHGSLAAAPRGESIDLLHGVRAAWLGDDVLLYARQSDGDRFDWWAVGGAAPRNLTATLSTPPRGFDAADDQGLAFLSDGGRWRLSRSGGLSPLGDEDDLEEVRAGPTFDLLRRLLNETPDRRWLPARRQGRTLILPAGRGHSFELGCAAEASGARVLAAARFGVVLRARKDGVTRLWLAHSNGCRSLDRVNGDLARRSAIRIERVDHRDRFGAATFSLLYLPPDRPLADVKGVIVSGYPGNGTGGPLYEAGVRQVGVNPLVMAANGYAWLQAATPLPVAPSAPVEGFGEGLALAEAAAETLYPDLPWARLAFYGHSFGGYGALVVATETGRYRSIIASAPTSNLVSAWGEFSPIERGDPQQGLSLSDRMGWVEEGQAGLGAPPWGARETYQAADPLWRADKISTPILLVTGDRDFVAMSGAEQMFSALHRQGKAGRILTYWGEGHFQWSPANQRDLYKEIYAWLDETLGSLSLRSSTAADPSTSPPKPRPRSD